jgi:hypothetical protein
VCHKGGSPPATSGPYGSTCALRETPKPDDDSHTFVLWVAFRDAAGLLWARDPDHRLIEITTAEQVDLMNAATRGERPSLRQVIEPE